MKKSLIKIRIILISISITLLAALLFIYSNYSFSGKEILVRTVAQDIRDVRSNNPVNLNYKFSESWSFAKRDVKNGDSKNKVYAILQEKNGYFEPSYLAYSQPLAIGRKQAMIVGNIDQYGHISYGIENYQSNEVSNSDLLTKNIDVILTIDENYQAKIKSIFVNGKEYKTDNKKD